MLQSLQYCMKHHVVVLDRVITVPDCIFFFTSTLRWADDNIAVHHLRHVITVLYSVAVKQNRTGIGPILEQTRSHEASGPSHHSKIWRPSRQHCCACQFSRCDHSYKRTRDFDTLLDRIIRRIIGFWKWHQHYSDVIMSTMASLITSLTSVYSAFHPGADQRKHQSSASLAFVRGIHRRPVNSPHKWPVTRKMFPFDDVIMKVSAFYAIRRLTDSCRSPEMGRYRFRFATLPPRCLTNYKTIKHFSALTCMPRPLGRLWYKLQS